MLYAVFLSLTNSGIDLARRFGSPSTSESLFARKPSSSDVAERAVEPNTER